MAQNINEHVISWSVLLNTKVDPKQLDGTVKLLRQRLSAIPVEINDAQTKKAAQDFVNEINAAFRELKMPEISFDDLQKDIAGVKQKIITAFKQTNNITADIFALDEIEGALKNIDLTITKMSKNLSRLAKASGVAQGFAKDINTIQKAAFELNSQRIDISDVFNFGSGRTDAAAMKNELNALKRQIERFDSDPNNKWAEKYATTIKFVKLYEQYSSLEGIKPSNPLKATYDKTRVGYQEKENVLRNVYNAQLGRDISATGRPSEGNWATENTVQEIRDILKKGITVTDATQTSTAQGSTPSSTTQSQANVETTPTQRQSIDSVEDFSKSAFTFYRGLDKDSKKVAYNAKDKYQFVTFASQDDPTGLKEAQKAAKTYGKHTMLTGNFTPRNPFIVDAHNQSWADLNTFDEFIEVFKGIKGFEDIRKDAHFKDTDPRISEIQLEILEAFRNGIIKDAQGRLYDSIIFKNIKDNAGTNTKSTPSINTAAIFDRSAIQTTRILGSNGKQIATRPDWIFPYLNEQEIKNLDLANYDTFNEAVGILKPAKAILDGIIKELTDVQKPLQGEERKFKTELGNAWQQLLQSLLASLFPSDQQWATEFKMSNYENFIKMSPDELGSEIRHLRDIQQSQTLYAPKYTPINTPEEAAIRVADTIENVITKMISEPSGDKEKFAFINTQTGQATQYVLGEDGSVNSSIVESQQGLVFNGYGSNIHQHREQDVTAAFSDSDLEFYLEHWTENLLHAFVLAGNQIMELDFTQFPEDQRKQLYEQFVNKITIPDDDGYNQFDQVDEDLYNPQQLIQYLQQQNEQQNNIAQIFTNLLQRVSENKDGNFKEKFAYVDTNGQEINSRVPVSDIATSILGNAELLSTLQNGLQNIVDNTLKNTQDEITDNDLITTLQQYIVTTIQSFIQQTFGNGAEMSKKTMSDFKSAIKFSLLAPLDNMAAEDADIDNKKQLAYQTMLQKAAKDFGYADLIKVYDVSDFLQRFPAPANNPSDNVVPDNTQEETLTTDSMQQAVENGVKEALAQEAEPALEPTKSDENNESEQTTAAIKLDEQSLIALKETVMPMIQALGKATQKLSQEVSTASTNNNANQRLNTLLANLESTLSTLNAAISKTANPSITIDTIGIVDDLKTINESLKTIHTDIKHITDTKGNNVSTNDTIKEANSPTELHNVLGLLNTTLSQLKDRLMPAEPTSSTTANMTSNNDAQQGPWALETTLQSMQQNLPKQSKCTFDSNAITDLVNGLKGANDVKTTVDVRPIITLLQEISGKLTSGVKLSNGSGTSGNGSNDTVAEDGKPKSKSKAKQGTINRRTAKGQTSLQRVVDYYYWLEEQAKAYEKNKPYVDAIQSVQQELLSDISRFDKKNEKPIVEYLRGETDTVPDVKWFQNLQSKHNLNMTRMAGQDDINSQNAIRKQALDLLRQEYKIRSDISTLERNGAKKDSLSVLQREIKDLSTLRQTLFSMLDADQQRLYIDEQIALTGKQHADDVRRQVKQDEADRKKAASQVESDRKKEQQAVNANNNKLRRLYSEQEKLMLDTGHDHKDELDWYVDEIARLEKISKLDQDEIDRIKQKVAARAAGKKADEEEKKRKEQEAADRKQQYEEEIAWRKHRLDEERRIQKEMEHDFKEHQQDEFDLAVGDDGQPYDSYFKDNAAMSYLYGGEDVDEVRLKISNYRDELEAAGTLTDELREKIDLLFADLDTAISSEDIDSVSKSFDALKHSVKVKGIEQRRRDKEISQSAQEDLTWTRKRLAEQRRVEQETERAWAKHPQERYDIPVDENGRADSIYFMDDAARTYLNGGKDIEDVRSKIENYRDELAAAGRLTDEIKKKIDLLFVDLDTSNSAEDIDQVFKRLNVLKEIVKIQGIEQRRLGADEAAQKRKEEKKQLQELLKLYKEKAQIEQRLIQIGNNPAFADERDRLNNRRDEVVDLIHQSSANKLYYKSQINSAYEDATNKAKTSLNKRAKLSTAKNNIEKFADLQHQLTNAAESIGFNGLDDNGLFTQFSNYLSSYKQLYDELSTKSQRGEVISEEEIQRLKDAKKNVDQYVTSLRNLYKDANLGDNQSNINFEELRGRYNFDKSNSSEYQHQLEALMKELTKGKGVVQSFDHETNTLTYTIKNGAHETQTLTLRVRDLDNGVTQTAKDTQYSISLMDNVRNKMREITQYFVGYSSVSRIIQGVRQGIQYVREIDAAMTELKKVTNETDEVYAKFMQDARKTAERVGATTKDIISSTADWARLGYSIQEAAKLSESTQVLLNVSEFTDVNKATDSLISSVQAFGYTADQSMHVVDILNEIGNNYAISTADLAQSLTKSSGALVTAGGDLAEAAALTATANSIIQDADVVGTALKTTSLRLRGTDVKILDEEGLDSDNVVTSKSKLRSKVKALSGVDILTDAGAYKSTYQILLEISKVWEDIDNMDQAALLELISGKRNASVISALLQAPETLEKAYESAQNASGSAEKENERYLDSISGRITLLQSAVQNFWTKLINADVVKRIVDLGTTLVKFIDTGTGKITALLVYIDSKVTKITPKILSIINPLKALDKAGKDFQDVLYGVVNTVNVFDQSNLSGNLSNIYGIDADQAAQLAQAFRDAADSNGNLNIQQATNILLTKGVTKEQSAATLSTLGFTTANQTLTFSFKNLGKATLAALKVLWPFIAVGAVVATTIAIVKHQEAKAIDTTKEFKEELEDLRTKVDSLNTELDNLHTQLEDVGDQIKALEALPTLSFVQEEELNRLKQVRKELTLQERIKKHQLEQEQNVLNDEQVRAGETWLTEQAYNMWQSMWSTDKRGNNKQLIQRRMIEYANNADQLHELEDQLNNVTDENIITDLESKIQKIKDKQIVLSKEINDKLAELAKQIGTSTSGAGYDFYMDSILQMSLLDNVEGTKATAIERLFDKSEFADIKQQIEDIDKTSDDAIVKITNLLNGSEQLKNELGKIMNLTLDDVIGYFTTSDQALDDSTLDNVFEQYNVALKALKEIKDESKQVTDYVKEAEDEFVVNEEAVATALRGASTDIRDEFEKLVIGIADGSLTIDNAIQYMTAKGNLDGLNLLNASLQELNDTEFKGIKDSLDGLIDTFTEFGAALKDVESAFTILNKAQTQMQHSGRLSVTTALDLINTTDRWNEILDVENGSIKLNGDYTKILIDDKLQLIKTNLELSLKTVKEQLAMLNSKDATEDFTMTIEESTNAAVQQLAGSMAYLNAMMEAYARIAGGDTSVDLAAAQELATQARDQTLEELAWTPTKETKTSKQELLKKQRDIQEQLKLLEGIDTADEFKKYYDYDKTPGDKYDDGKSALDLLKAKYESLIDNLTNQQKWLQNEVDRLQAENKGVSRSYYEKQIELEEQKLHLYEQERAELQALLGTTAQGTDEYKDVASALWEVEFAIQDSVKAAIEFRKQIIDLYKTAFDKLKTLYGNQDEFLENQQTYIDKYNELQNALGKTGKREDIQRQLDIESEQVLYNQRLLDDLRKTRDDAMANGQMEAGSEEWIDMESNIRAVEMALLDGQLAVEKYKQALIDLYVNAFATLNEMFSNKNNFLNSQQGYITGYVDYLKELDIDAPSEAYKALIEIEEEKKKNNLDNLKEVKQNIADLENEFTAQGLSPDLYGTKKEWVDAVNKAIELEKALQDNDIAVAQWNKIINEMDFSKFDEFISRIGDLEKEIKHIVSVLYKNKEDIALEDGTWTSEGITVLGMYYHQMEVAKKKAAEYAQEIEELNEKYDAGSMSEKQYYERLQALKDGQWDAIDAYKEAKDSIVDLNAARIDMIEKGINEEIKAYNELLDLKKKELSAERDLYNFKKSTEEKTKSIAETQRKLAALSNSTSASDIAQSRKLQAELAKQQEDLNDSYYSHAMDSQQQALDDEGSLFEKTRNDYLEDLRKKLEEVDTIISESISDVLLNADVALNTLNEVSATYGVTLSDNLTNPWKEASIASTAWKEDISSALTSMINSDGVVTLFGNNAVASFGNVSTAINDMKLKADEFASTTTDFETVGAAATTFSTNVTTGMQDILDQLNGKGKNGFTTEMTNGLKAPWDALNDKDSSLVTFSTKVAEQLDNAIDYAANNYASIMQGHLESPFDNASMSTFNENVKGALDKALADAREAADAINRTMDFDLPSYQGGIGGTGGTNGGGGSSSGGGTNTTGSKQSTMTKDDIMELQKFLKIYWDSSVVVDGIYGAGTKKAVQGMQRAINQFLQPVGGPYANDDGLYTQRTIDSLKAYYDLKDKTTGIKHIISVPKKAYYAKGTTGTSKSQWAITDEYGPELTMYATKEGNLSYMRAGSTVVPADITKKLLSMVDEYQPNLTFNQPGVPVLNNIVTNNSAINLHFDSFIKAEHITDATMPELNSLIDKKIDDFNRKINYALRRV